MQVRPATILVIEDDPDHRFLLAERLRLAFAEERIVMADSGEAALQLARRTRPSVIVLDLHLPGIEGFEFAAEIRRFAPGAPIVVLTGDTSRESRRRAEDEQFSAFLLKPEGVRELSDVLRSLLGAGVDARPRSNLTTAPADLAPMPPSEGRQARAV